MLTTAIKTVLGIIVIFGGWLLVQAAWRRVFPGVAVDEDILAGRIGCHGCTQDSSCDQLNCSGSDTQLPSNQ